MKRRLSFTALAAVLLACFLSCEKVYVPGKTTQLGEGKYLKTIHLGLDGGQTKADDSTIADATLFVYQTSGGSETFYKRIYTESPSSVTVDLFFSDQVDYTYIIRAYGNMGELASEPQDGEVLFSSEESTGLQMKGSKSGINQSSAPSVTIDMKRYVGKITVSEVALAWTNKQNAVREFTLKSIYIANAGDKAEGAVATYNVDGAYVSSAMDAMLYSPVSSVIADGAKYDTPQMMYAYGSGTTELVLECDLGGQIMYYHLPYESEANTHTTIKLTIHKAGASSPLGELPEESIEVSFLNLYVHGLETETVVVSYEE